MGRGGEIFMLDMGEPVRILDLARDLIRLSGFADEVEIRVITGMRPGEKLFEELYDGDEELTPTRQEKILRGDAPARSTPTGSRASSPRSNSCAPRATRSASSPSLEKLVRRPRRAGVPGALD